MYILDQTGRRIVNIEAVTRFAATCKTDCELIVAVFDEEHVPVALGRYATFAEARGVMTELFDALRGGQSYTMPLSRVVAPEQEVHDARKRRKGGS